MDRHDWRCCWQGVASSTFLALCLAACGGSSAAPGASPATSVNPAPSQAAPASGAGAAAARPSSAGSNSTSTKPAASANGSQDWGQVVTAAKAEGKLAAITAPGDVYRHVFDAFQAKYGIQVELRTGNGTPDLVPQLLTERKGEQYLWDVTVNNPIVMFTGFKPAGALDPLRPAMILPEVTDNSKWIGGFDAGWADSDKAYSYDFISYLDWTAFVNRDVIPESQLNTLDQLWDPKWKGKIAVQDPRVPSAGGESMATILAVKGEDKTRQLLSSQALVTTLDRRQLFEWVLRGEYPIGIGLSPGTFQDFAAQSVNTSQIKPIANPDDRANFKLGHGSGSIGLFNKAPHPNAAKVFLNWQLSQEGQAVYAKETTYNSRRNDVPPVDPTRLIDQKVDAVDSSLESNYHFQQLATAMAKEILK